MTPEQAIFLKNVYLGQIEHESKTTRRVLGSVPADKCSYKPDPKSMGSLELAWHIANTDVQFLDGIADLNFKMETPESKPTTIAELVAWYDTNFKRSAERVRAMSAEKLGTPIEFFGVFNLPAVAYLGFLNNHSIHHRGELATYLRPMGSKCPSIYGGSYDEPFQPPQPKTTAA